MPSSPYADTLPNWRERLKQLMAAKRFNARSLSDKAGLNPGAVSEWLNPNKLKKPSFAALASVANALDVSIAEFTNEPSPPPVADEKDIASATISYASLMGDIGAGIWREPMVYAIDDTSLVPVVPHPDFKGVPQHAWRVIGNSMNRIAKPGAYVIGVSFHDIKRWRRLSHNDIVVCERRDGCKVETTLKRAIWTDRGFRLDAESDDPMFAGTLWLPDNERAENVEVDATYLIIGAFNFFL